MLWYARKSVTRTMARSIISALIAFLELFRLTWSG